MEKFDAVAELQRIRELRQVKRYRKSKLDRFRTEILALDAAGASTSDIALWLREHKLKADASTVGRYLAKQKALIRNAEHIMHDQDIDESAAQISSK
jgi:1,6-anhydro-N-acetylmuramate kinase